MDGGDAEGSGSDGGGGAEPGWMGRLSARVGPGEGESLSLGSSLGNQDERHCTRLNTVGGDVCMLGGRGSLALGILVRVHYMWVRDGFSLVGDGAFSRPVRFLQRTVFFFEGTVFAYGIMFFVALWRWATQFFF